MSALRENLKAGREYFLDRAERDIEKNRMDDMQITVNCNGKPLRNAEVSYKLQKIDFDFGCNIFMLDQYGDKDRQDTYLEQWKRIFNTAVVPFYWEGTEPQKGYLRYSKDVPNDFYRRPPADRVVEYCKENGISMKGHPLFWHEIIPRWLPENWNELFPLIEKRFKEIADRYSVDIPVFDCVNEPSRIWDMCYEHKSDGYKMVVPPSGYVEEIFKLASKYFPSNELILNEATGAALCEFKGEYGGFYQLLEKLIGRGVKIDRIGLQCHVNDSDYFKNVFNAERFYGVLDGYSKLGRPLVLSEIGLSCDDEELQAQAAEQIYKICFSVDEMSGIFWWNLDDDGILMQKDRRVVGENLPYGGLCRSGREKAAYKALNRLINQEWTSYGKFDLRNGKGSFRGFYGSYEITVKNDGVVKNFVVDFPKNGENSACLEW